MTRPRASRAARPAFTLVELLAALGVLALLAALAYGVGADVLVRARQVKCAANMRQIGQAMHLYAQAHGGWLPETSHNLAPDQRGRAWVFTLAPYLGNVNEVRISPGDPRAAERSASGGTSYVLNSFIFIPKRDPFGRMRGTDYRRMDRIPRPERTILAFQIAETAGLDALNDHTHSDLWVTWDAVLRDIQPDAHHTGPAGAKHDRGAANYLFADTHVESWDAADARRRIEKRDNFAKPPPR